MVDQYQNDHHGSPNCCAFMITAAEDVVVDYRSQWQSVGKGEFKPASNLQVTASKTSNPNRFHSLQETNSSGSISNECAWSGNLDGKSAEFTIPEQCNVPQTKLNVDNFPSPVPDKHVSVRHKMPRMPKVSRQNKVRFGCDADSTSMGRFDNILNNSIKQNGCNDQCCAPMITPSVIHQSPEEPIQLLTSSIQEIPRPSQHVDKSDQRIAIGPQIESIRMAQTMMANMVKQNLEVSQTVIDLANAEVDLITENPDSSILNLNQKMVWVQVPCAVDSGACANVTPAGIFSLEKSLLKLDPKFFGADGSPIENLGSMVTAGTSEEGIEMKIDFDIAKVTRPLLSVHKMTSNGHKVIFDDAGGYIQVKGSNSRIKLRPEGRLFMLDLWVKVPQEIADSSPFVRQVAKA